MTNRIVKQEAFNGSYHTLLLPPGEYRANRSLTFDRNLKRIHSGKQTLGAMLYFGWEHVELSDVFVSDDSFIMQKSTFLTPFTIHIT